MPSKIEWCDETINPLGWGCYGPDGTPDNPKPCSYCYAKRMANRGLRNCDLCNQFIPHVHPEQLEILKKWKKPKKIFVQSMGDLFHDAIPDEWIQEVFKACEAAPQHTYMFLTKNPKRYMDLKFYIPLPTSDKYWYGTTINSQDDLRRHCVDLMNFPHRKFLSIEPLLGPVDLSSIEALSGDAFWNALTGDILVPFTMIQRAKIPWVIVGAQSGPGAVPPKPEGVQKIIDQCRDAGVPIFLKDNLRWPERIQEYPEGMVSSDARLL